MQTHFSPRQLADPHIAEADRILRACVHCGFCTATCPTYVLLGDENDSPRGRIYLMKNMLEGDKAASPAVRTHIDRCLSCLSCMTTCPSGVDYMHLVDHVRTRIEQTAPPRPLPDRMLRAILRWLLPRPGLFRWAMAGARLGRPFARLLPGRLPAMFDIMPPAPPTAPLAPGIHAAEGRTVARVALLAGCVQQVIGRQINEATIRLLNRLGVEVVLAGNAGCCGALAHHMGHEDEAKAKARANIAAWIGEKRRGGLDAVIINASGCGTTVKDYGHMLPGEAGAAEIASMTLDISEFLEKLDWEPTGAGRGTVVAYHAACSLQHGQRVREAPRRLLAKAGFEVRDIPESHLCCGSAGTYNILQPEIARHLRDRKAANIESVAPQVVAAGNIGCIIQIGGGTRLPVLHTVELLDWATGGPKPAALGG